MACVPFVRDRDEWLANGATNGLPIMRANVGDGSFTAGFYRQMRFRDAPER